MPAPWIIVPKAPVVQETESNDESADVKSAPPAPAKAAVKRPRKKMVSTSKSSGK